MVDAAIVCSRWRRTRKLQVSLQMMSSHTSPRCRRITILLSSLFAIVPCRIVTGGNF